MFSFTKTEKERFVRLKSIFCNYRCFSASDHLYEIALDYAEFYAGQGSIEGLKWYSEIEEDVFPPDTLAFAVLGDHKEAIKWLREHGCPWGRAMSLAKFYSDNDLVEWLKEEGCPPPRPKLKVQRHTVLLP